MEEGESSSYAPPYSDLSTGRGLDTEDGDCDDETLIAVTHGELAGSRRMVMQVPRILIVNVESLSRAERPPEPG